ncbi:photosystem I assembly protein Ycf3 [Bacteroidales bacterium Barb6]|nr:photosystem I assembly protein Ycf3 [Bacteroidales bacterium Barb6]
MRIKVLLATFGLAAGISGAYAQTGAVSGTQFGHGEDSIRCITNISLFGPYAKSGNFKDALPFWEIAYNECPGAHKDIYLHGVRIVAWEIANEQDPAKKEALIDKLMGVYDKRIKYFGNDKRYGTDWILGRKAQDYIQYKGENIDPKLLRDWLVVALDGYGEETEALAVSQFLFASLQYMLKEPAHKEQYIQDYLRASAIFEAQLATAAATNNAKDEETLKTYKTAADLSFAGSGAADCEILQSLYAEKVEQNKDNMDYLKETLGLLKRVRCLDIDVYFAASRYVHVNEPSAESAVGLGKQAVRDKDYELAIKYFDEAADLETEPNSKADDYYMIALLMYEQNNLSRARQYANKVLEQNPGYGSAYLLIGNMYAASSKSVYPNDAVLARAVYNVAIDKFEKARQVDPSIADEANRLIGTYRAYLPSTEDIFMHPDLEKGKPFTIGGWIGERTTIR